MYMYLKMNFIAPLVNGKLQLKVEYLVIIQVLQYSTTDTQLHVHVFTFYDGIRLLLYDHNVIHNNISTIYIYRLEREREREKERERESELIT